MLRDRRSLKAFGKKMSEGQIRNMNGVRCMMETNDLILAICKSIRSPNFGPNDTGKPSEEFVALTLCLY